MKESTKLTDVYEPPFRAHKPAESNGYVYVKDNNGSEVATCYKANGATVAASAIAYALNELVEVRDEDRNTVAAPRSMRELLLQAADLIEREEHYDFMQCYVPRSCGDVGCVLGWVSYLLGYDKNESLDVAAQHLGYKHQNAFYDAMADVCKAHYGSLRVGEWQDNAKVAARVLRILAVTDY